MAVDVRNGPSSLSYCYLLHMNGVLYIRTFLSKIIENTLTGTQLSNKKRFFTHVDVSVVVFFTMGYHLLYT